LPDKLKPLIHLLQVLIKMILPACYRIETLSHFLQNVLHHLCAHNRNLPLNDSIADPKVHSVTGSG
jgi:hypothetical protein